MDNPPEPKPEDREEPVVDLEPALAPPALPQVDPQAEPVDPEPPQGDPLSEAFERADE